MFIRNVSRWMTLVGIACGYSACASSGIYVPTEQVSAEVQGSPAARYEVPPEAPRGDISVTSRGIVKISPQQGGDTVRMLNVVVSLSNDQDAGPWTFDVRQQRLSMWGARLAPALTSSPEQVVQVPPGQVRVVDLYFQAPAGTKPRNIGDFDLLWRVDTPKRTVAQRTPFERLKVEEMDPYALAPYWGYGWGWNYGAGPYGYYNSLYYPASYYGAGYGPVLYRPYPGGVTPWYPGYGIRSYYPR